jgi:hypothetical protein
VPGWRNSVSLRLLVTGIPAFNVSGLKVKGISTGHWLSITTAILALPSLVKITFRFVDAEAALSLVKMHAAALQPLLNAVCNVEWIRGRNFPIQEKAFLPLSLSVSTAHLLYGIKSTVTLTSIASILG